MRIHRLVLVLLFAGTLVLCTSCDQSGSSLPPGATPPYVPSADTIARIHWLGKERLGIAASASYLMRIWALPQSGQLEAQTLGKLSTFPARWSAGGTPATNMISSLTQPLLADVVFNECYLEIRHPAGQPAEFAFAIRLTPDRAEAWQTNVALILQTLTGINAGAAVTDPRGWTFKRPAPLASVDLNHAGRWTIISTAPDDHVLRDEVLNWIRNDPAPAVGNYTNNWLEAEVDLQRLAATLPPTWSLPAGLPKISLVVNGDGAHVLTYGNLNFSRAISSSPEPWNFPTNLLSGPLDSLTAIRGANPWLDALNAWHAVPLGTPPDQFYFWSLPGSAPQVYIAAPVPDARNRVTQITKHLLEKTNPWLVGHGYVSFEPMPDSNGVVWGNTPSFQPFLRFADAGGVILGGLSLNMNPGTNAQDNLFERPPLSRLLDRISSQTNLVYYDWELTGSRIEPCLYLGQAARVVSRHVQLPLDSASLEWLRAIEPRLGNCTTIVTRTDTNQLSFFRRSTVGFSGAELQLLADWLESPQFPSGLYSLRASPPPQP